MSDVVNYLNCRMGITALHAQTGMDTKSSQYVELCKAAVCAVKQVCLGPKGITPQELAELLRCIADAPIDEQFRCELRGICNQKLSSDPYVNVHRSTLTKVEFPENYLRHMDWEKFMSSQEYVNSKLIHLAKFWANLGLPHPTDKIAKVMVACAVLTEQESVIVGPCVLST